MKQEFGLIGDLLKDGRTVELFRSSDPHNTALYWTHDHHDMTQEERNNLKATFQLIRFDYDVDKHQVYVKYPDSDHFIELFGAGMGSGRGNMMKSSGRNVWGRKYHKKIQVLSQDPQLLYIDDEFNSNFNFMTLIARKGKPENSFLYRDRTGGAFFNESEFEKLSNEKYLKIPEDVRTIEYLYKTTGLVNNLTFCIHYPTYNFGYNNQVFNVIDKDSVKEYKVINFIRYKDGGTTIITVEDDKGEKHKFFSPTRLGIEHGAGWKGEDGKVITDVLWDDTHVLQKITDEKEIKSIVDLLGIELEEKDEE